METALFQQFADLAYHRAGIRLGAGKEALVGARIGKRLRVLGLQSPSAYLEHLLRDTGGEELVHFLDVISTNFTGFYRESEHFQYIRDLVKARRAAGRGRLRFWSAACSSGEEPYTMAITIADALSSANVNWRILGTDISTRILKTAEAATYHASALRNVPRHLKSKYFHRLGDRAASDPLFQVQGALRSHVIFRRLNLSAPPFPMRGPIDAVMCRNVMIYFDQRVRQNLIAAVEEVLAPDGMLFIGHAETLNGLKTRLRAIRPSVYVLPTSTQYPGALPQMRTRGRVQ